MNNPNSLMPFVWLFGLFTLATVAHAAKGWWRVAREGDRERTNERPVLNVTFVRAAAERTAMALAVAGITLAIWLIDVAQLAAFASE